MALIALTTRSQQTQQRGCTDMNGLFGGMLGGAKPTTPQQSMFRNPLPGALSQFPVAGGMFNSPGTASPAFSPALMQKMQGLGQNAQSPMTHFGLGMMGGGGWAGGIQGTQAAMQAQRQQQQQEMIKKLLMAQGGGLGGGGLMGGPAPASIY